MSTVTKSRKETRTHLTKHVRVRRFPQPGYNPLTADPHEDRSSHVCCCSDSEEECEEGGGGGHRQRKTSSVTGKQIDDATDAEGNREGDRGGNAELEGGDNVSRPIGGRCNLRNGEEKTHQSNCDADRFPFRLCQLRQAPHLTKPLLHVLGLYLLHFRRNLLDRLCCWLSLLSLCRFRTLNCICRCCPYPCECWCIGGR